MTARHSLELRPRQVELWNQLERFSILVLHRRFGKTVLAICKVIDDVQECEYPYPRGHYFAPFRNQAKTIAWHYLQILTRPLPGMQYNKTDLIATFPSGATIQLFGADNPDNFRGNYSDSVILDEVAQMPRRMWGEIVRPALADRKGKAMFIGTPFGKHNMFHELFERAAELPNWFRQLWTAEETGVIDEDELAQLKLEMSTSEYQQEMLCMWDAAVKGAYYGEQMQQAELDGRIRAVPWSPELEVHTAWDLGMNDATAIWFIQTIGAEIRCVDHVEFTGTGLPDIVNYLRAKPYNYGTHYAPPDIRVRELGTGVSRYETAIKLGLTFSVVKNIGLMDGIDATRTMLPRCWFDETNCQLGLDALRMYRTEFDDKKGIYSLKPLHDWASNSADALRYFALGTMGGQASAFQTEIDYSRLDRGVI